MTMKISDNGIDRDMTEAEQAEHAATIAEHQSAKKAEAQAEAAKAAARQKVLDKLGLTQDEAQALLG